MTPEANTVTGWAHAVWRMRLDSALRAALACATIGCATLYGPDLLRKEIKFVAFSYLTAVLIVYDATLGDTLRGCWYVLCATAQVVPPAMLARWAAGGGLPVGVAALAAATASFVVALPECTHVTAKRIALGQIVLVCTDMVLVGGGMMRPAYVAASTGLGALASVLALVVPYPGLACYRVRKLCRLYAENASQRIDLYLRAFSARDERTKKELLSQAKPFAETGAKLLQSIIILQEGVKWERPWCGYLNPDLVGPTETLPRMELQMRGIEYSLASSPALPVLGTNQEQFSNFLHDISARLKQKIEQLTCYSPSQSTTESEIRKESTEKPLALSLQAMFPTLDHKWALFCISCVDMLLKIPTNSCMIPKEPPLPKTESKAFQTFKTWILNLARKGQLESALKCSLSLGLAILFGLIFDRENGCWAGLTIAISFVTNRQPVFTVANSRAQGTAVGSAYGVICCFLFHKEEFRLLAVLPWIVLTSFLRHSQMYGPNGGVSAAIGALLILGRKHYGPPNEFAIARMAEVFIGLSALVAVDLLVQPTRAATLAKNRLCQTLSALHDCMKEMGTSGQLGSKFNELGEKRMNFNSLVQELKKTVEEANLEPNFWYLPFRTSCYQRMVGSLSNIGDTLYFVASNFETLSGLSENTGAMCSKLHEWVKSDLELFQEDLRCAQVHLETANLTKCQANSQEGSYENFRDIEAGQNPYELNVLSAKHEMATKNTESDGEKLWEQMIQCLGATWFCLTSLMREIDDIKNCIKEINQWENHSMK